MKQYDDTVFILVNEVIILGLFCTPLLSLLLRPFQSGDVENMIGSIILLTIFAYSAALAFKRLVVRNERTVFESRYMLFIIIGMVFATGYLSAFIGIESGENKLYHLFSMFSYIFFVGHMMLSSDKPGVSKRVPSWIELGIGVIITAAIFFLSTKEHYILQMSNALVYVLLIHGVLLRFYRRKTHS